MSLIRRTKEKKINKLFKRIIELCIIRTGVSEGVKQMDNTEKLLKQIIENQNETNKRLERIESKLDAVNKQTANLTEFQTEANMKLDKIGEDIDFLKHKEYLNEQDIFSIKKQIQAI